MLSGRLEKALKYADKAQAQIEQIKSMDRSPFLSAVEMLFYECRIQSHLIFGNKSVAIKEVNCFFFIYFYCLDKTYIYLDQCALPS